MAPLVVLFLTFATLWLIDRYLLDGRLGLSFIGRAAMAAMLVVTGVAHFTSTEAMVGMMPEFVPFKREVIYFTGVCELLAVAGLLWGRTARLTSVALMIFFVAVLPANVIGSLKRIPLGGMEYGAAYLLFRVPLQVFLVWWAYHFGVRYPVTHGRDRP